MRHNRLMRRHLVLSLPVLVLPSVIPLHAQMLHGRRFVEGLEAAELADRRELLYKRIEQQTEQGHEETN